MPPAVLAAALAGRTPSAEVPGERSANSTTTSRAAWKRADHRAERSLRRWRSREGRQARRRSRLSIATRQHGGLPEHPARLGGPVLWKAFGGNSPWRDAKR